MKINLVQSLKGSLKVPGDKSISHRSIMLGGLARGTTSISGFLLGADCLSTIKCFTQMGIAINITQDTIRVKGKGLHGLSAPKNALDVGNSGTTMRLMSGILVGQAFDSIVTGDDSIKQRPMGRIITPLTMMGADIKSFNSNDKAPLIIKGYPLHSIRYTSPVASAQIKSSIMFANLYTGGTTLINEPYISRNHSEIMFNHFGGHITTNGNEIICHPIDELYANEVTVPADISSAAYFIVAGLIIKDSEIILRNVGINPTRDGIIKVLKDMNGNIELDNIRTVNGEKIADIIVKSSTLTATTIEKGIIPKLIDEIPIIAVAAAFAEGTTVIKDAAELKVKESNRIDACVTELSKMNIDIQGTDDGMIIRGGNPLQGTTVESYHDHRVAMSLAIAGLAANGTTVIKNSNCIDISYPTFFEDIKTLV